jgi:hypothetical protein
MPEPTFKTWQAFSNFERDVRKNRRFVRSPDADEFLSAVRQTVSNRKSKISRDRGLWRAQLGFTWRYLDEIGDEIPAAFPPERMKPLRDRASEGRANPKGIPMLYLCSNRDAAMSEVRPWLGSLISLGYFRTKRDLALVDCTRNPIRDLAVFLERPEAQEWDDIVWSEIDRAFTTPVSNSDDSCEYVATQILVELFREMGFDGIAYRSAFGERSTNIALFDLDAADLESCQLHEVSSLNVNFRERENPYWVKKKAAKSASRARRP